MEKWNIRKNKMLPVIFALAWPTMLEQFLQTAVQYIDTAMVGSLGTQATAAVGSTSTVNWLIGSYKESSFWVISLNYAIFSQFEQADFAAFPVLSDI